MKAYKNSKVSSRLSGLSVFSIFYFLFNLSFAGPNEEQLATSVLSEVRQIASKTKNLEELGKQSLSQATVLLDLKEPVLPVLEQILLAREENWKVRYWVTDLVGYIGNVKTSEKLLKIVTNNKELSLIRRRALDSILEIERRNAGFGKRELKIKLQRIEKKIKNLRVKKKIQRLIQSL